MDDDEDIEVTEETLSFHSNVRENIVSFYLDYCVENGSKFTTKWKVNI